MTRSQQNFQTSGCSIGGKAWGFIASLSEICKVNGVAPLACLTSNPEAIAACHPKSRINDPAPMELSAVKLKTQRN